MKDYGLKIRSLPSESQNVTSSYGSLDYPEGVYSTIADSEFLESLPHLESVDDSMLEERPIEIKRVNGRDIGQAVGSMFRNLSQPVDIRCTSHRNGVENLFFASNNPNVDKNDSQEVKVAMLEEKWYGRNSRRNEVYMGFSVRVK